MADHTPGPWEAQWETVYQVDGFGLCYLEGKRAKADALLIAAAPDLLEVALVIVSDGHISIPIAIQDKARAAIAKAKGEA